MRWLSKFFPGQGNATEESIVDPAIAENPLADRPDIIAAIEQQIEIGQTDAEIAAQLEKIARELDL